VEEVNEVMKKAADGKILAYNDKPLVSIDFNHTSTTSNFDATMTRVIDGKLVKVCSWYDNEWGFSNRMLDTTIALMNAK
jgi:glyceraldehyde 3-phosphate dehydrogenase